MTTKTRNLRHDMSAVYAGRDAVDAIRRATCGIIGEREVRDLADIARSAARRAVRYSLPSWAKAIDLTVERG